jgi:hypothetical protein
MVLNAILIAISAAVVPSASATDVDSERALFDRCPDHGPAEIYPPLPEDDPDVLFFYLADIEKPDQRKDHEQSKFSEEVQCGPLVHVQHIVKNLHAANWFHFIWDDLDSSASLIAPRNGLYSFSGKFENYQGQLVKGEIRYGVNLDSDYTPRVSASHYPLSVQKAQLLLDPGNFVAQSLEVDTMGPSGGVEKVRFELTSRYNADFKLTTYTLERNTDNVVIAMGNLAGTAVGEKIADTFSILCLWGKSSKRAISRKCLRAFEPLIFF